MTEDEFQGIRAILSTTPARWKSLAAAPDSLVRREPLPGEWSALGCLRHLVAAETSHRERIESMVSGSGRASQATGPGRQAEEPATVADKPDEPAALADQLAALRLETLAVLDRVTPADLERTGSHPRHGTITLAQLLAHLAAHDLDHTIQAERALMQPLIEVSGPWRRSHADHDAVARAAGRG